MMCSPYTYAYLNIYISLATAGKYRGESNMAGYGCVLQKVERGTVLAWLSATYIATHTATHTVIHNATYNAVHPATHTAAHTLTYTAAHTAEHTEFHKNKKLHCAVLSLSKS